MYTRCVSIPPPLFLERRRPKYRLSQPNRSCHYRDITVTVASLQRQVTPSGKSIAQFPPAAHLGAAVFLLAIPRPSRILYFSRARKPFFTLITVIANERKSNYYPERAANYASILLPCHLVFISAIFRNT